MREFQAQLRSQDRGLEAAPSLNAETPAQNEKLGSSQPPEAFLGLYSTQNFLVFKT